MRRSASFYAKQISQGREGGREGTHSLGGLDSAHERVERRFAELRHLHRRLSTLAERERRSTHSIARLRAEALKVLLALAVEETAAARVLRRLLGLGLGLFGAVPPEPVEAKMLLDGLLLLSLGGLGYRTRTRRRVGSRRREGADPGTGTLIRDLALGVVVVVVFVPDRGGARADEEPEEAAAHGVLWRSMWGGGWVDVGGWTT